MGSVFILLFDRLQSLNSLCAAGKSVQYHSLRFAPQSMRVALRRRFVQMTRWSAGARERGRLRAQGLHRYGGSGGQRRRNAAQPPAGRGWRRRCLLRRHNVHLPGRGVPFRLRFHGDVHAARLCSGARPQALRLASIRRAQLCSSRWARHLASLTCVSRRIGQHRSTLSWPRSHSAPCRLEHTCPLVKARE